MAAKKSGGPARGAALVKKAIEASVKASTIASPEAVPAGILKKLRLPDDEKLPAGLKTFLAHDASLLGWEFDDEEPEFEPMSLDELVAQEFGDDTVSAFGEACEMYGDDCVLIAATDGDDDTRSFLYVGTPDESGEYPVITLDNSKGARVAGIAPFDVWIAQRLGLLAKGDAPGDVPEEYVPASQALADANGDGRRAYESQHRDIAAGGDDEDEDEDEDEGEPDEKAAPKG
jgi:hypothetical protein